MKHGWILAATAALGAIYLPLIPGATALMRAALDGKAWRALACDPQFLQALYATVISTLISVGGATSLALLVVAHLWQTSAWTRFRLQLPFLLAIPHVAFAASLLLLFADGGWLSQLIPGWHPGADPLGIGLGAALALKESGFVIWATHAALGRCKLDAAFTMGRSLGFGPGRAFFRLIVPQLRGDLGWIIATLTAWSLFVVDVALMIGPGNPPTLSTLAWQWINQPHPELYAKGLVTCLILIALFAGLMALLWVLCRLPWPAARVLAKPGGLSLRPGRPIGAVISFSGHFCLITLALASGLRRYYTSADAHVGFSAAVWKHLDLTAFYSSLTLGIICAIVGLGTVICWLMAGGRGMSLLWLPLLLPVQPLVIGQYQIMLALHFENSLLAVAWGHLLWVVPYMAFLLAPTWQSRDRRQELCGLSLGLPLWRVRLFLMLPMMVRPALAALAVGFSVSTAQYLPTLYLGAGRVTTLTSEAVALSSGGDMRLLAAHSLLQLLLPLTMFIICVQTGRLTARWRRGLT